MWFKGERWQRVKEIEEWILFELIFRLKGWAALVHLGIVGSIVLQIYFGRTGMIDAVGFYAVVFVFALVREIVLQVRQARK